MPAPQWIEERKKVRRKFRILFETRNLAGLTRENFGSFLNFEVNRSWTGLHRHRTEVTRDMQRLRDAIAFLQDESIDIKTRINELLSEQGKYQIRGIGQNLVTAILHVCDEREKYGVWNNRAVSSLRKLGLFTECSSDKGECYTNINRVLCELRDRLHTDLATIDAFMYYIDTTIEKPLRLREKMHYMRLLAALQKYRESETRWRYYDEYMNNKPFRLWESCENIPKIEIMKLFGFILSWDRNFEGDLGKFEQIYKDIYPLIRELQNESLKDIELNEAVKSSIQRIFDKVARCTVANKYESTDASKIIHTLIPELFVMWDRRIREGIWKDEKWEIPVKFTGKEYAFKFLPLMQERAREAIESFGKEKDCDHREAISEISKLGKGNTIAKMLDEYNYVKYTLRQQI